MKIGGSWNLIYVGGGLIELICGGWLIGGSWNLIYVGGLIELLRYTVLVPKSIFIGPMRCRFESEVQ